MVLDQPTTL
jgi:hypothetical protein